MPLKHHGFHEEHGKPQNLWSSVFPFPIQAPNAIPSPCTQQKRNAVVLIPQISSCNNMQESTFPSVSSKQITVLLNSNPANYLNIIVGAAQCAQGY